jgi:hypothetical protein
MNTAWAALLYALLAVPFQESPEKVKKLIETLNSDEAGVREAASRALLELGESARPALESAKRDANAEVSARIAKVLELLDFGILASRAPWEFDAFKKELSSAFSLEGTAKWKALRKLGIRLSDEEFAAAEKVKPLRQKNPIFEHWVDLRPEQAARWGAALTQYVSTEKDDLRNIAANLVIQWAGKDRDAARRWVDKLPKGEVRRRLATELDRLK